MMMMSDDDELMMSQVDRDLWIGFYINVSGISSNINTMIAWSNHNGCTRLGAAKIDKIIPMYLYAQKYESAASLGKFFGITCLEVDWYWMQRGNASDTLIRVFHGVQAFGPESWLCFNLSSCLINDISSLYLKIVSQPADGLYLSLQNFLQQLTLVFPQTTVSYSRSVVDSGSSPIALPVGGQHVSYAYACKFRQQPG
jgi:hypothetical protein